ncbi:heme ABC transporter permease [Zavarzinia compransoris]|uniref:Heme exporter protein C n=1 Tax=Zavarzinia compransoris TaxID=1264899 RepID=A0A317E4L5_9PROT|nr:heme ABC transporter permease [Zavarzinia compransoris]PWR22068.1 heme transporter HemC [Zavarzinia compransoris]TDP47190.1 heme exporter protein C [Zavarzinia compransoris]
MFTRLANPTRFIRLADRLLPWLGGLTLIAFAVGLAWGLGFAPPDYQQGDTVRIMFVHVPAAWLSMFAYSFMAAASFVALVWKHPLADVAAKAAAPLGAGFCLVALVTGSLWGQPMWGTWWVWDARLTSMLVLFFLYVGYIALWSAIDEPERAARAAAILALVGAVNVPIVKFSVDWWSTLHQPASVIRMDGPTIDASILWPLAICALAFQLYFVTVLLWRMKAELLNRRIRALTLGLAAREA